MTALETINYRDFMSTADEIVAEAHAGRMFILVDDEDRENEGDIIIPAQFATPDAINFMAKHARGLICLAMTRSRCNQLGLMLMNEANGSRFETAFTVSIEARKGVTTGISAADRARTIAAAVNPELGRDDITTPGHVFPLMARDGGTLIRAGHTEAAVDIARLAGLIPAGVICEIINNDGQMARLPDLVAFSQLHNIRLGTIADLIAYRIQNEKLVTRKQSGMVPDGRGGTWRTIAFEDTIEHVEHLVLIKGDITSSEPVLVRVHAINGLGDILDNSNFKLLQGAMQEIANAGRGVVVVVRDGRRDAVSNRINELSQGIQSKAGLRDYGVGAQILVDLGLVDMILLTNNQRTIVGLEGYGLNVVEQRTMPKFEGIGI